MLRIHGINEFANESAVWNVLIVDTSDTTTHQLVAAFIDRVYEAGSNSIAVIAEPKVRLFFQRMP